MGEADDELQQSKSQRSFDEADSGVLLESDGDSTRHSLLKCDRTTLLKQSLQQLPPKFDLDSSSSNSSSSSTLHSPSKSDCGYLLRSYNTVLVLCLINAFNFINRYTLPPVVSRLQADFHLTQTQLGLIQTVFEFTYVLSSLCFGYLGDRLDRRRVIAVALLLGNCSGFLCSYLPADQPYSFALFVSLRAVLALGEAAFSNIGPTLIADMFLGRTRTLVIALFQFAIPVGCGLGYIVSSMLADAYDDWRVVFRLTLLPVLCSVLNLLLLVREPKRGEAELATSPTAISTVATPSSDDSSSLLSLSSLTLDKSGTAADNSSDKSSPSALATTQLPIERERFAQVLCYLVQIPSFMFTTLAFVGVAFATGALCYWTPYLIVDILNTGGGESSASEVGFIFGGITILSGMAGVLIGAMASNHIFKPYFGAAADAVVCGITMLMAAAFLFASLGCIDGDMTLVWLLIFGGITFLCCCWVLISEITLNVVVPTRRSTAYAFQAMLSHLLGDAAGPYLIGLISDQLRLMPWIGQGSGLPLKIQAMRYSLMSAPLMTVLAGGLFLMASLYLNADARRVDMRRLRRAPAAPVEA